MHFQKQDLEGEYYNWEDDSKSLYTGQPTRRNFDRYNGNQILFLINFYGSLSERFTITEGVEMERRILFDMPEEIRSEISVFNWLRKKEHVV